VIPIIRCEKGSVAEAVAVKLDSRLKDYILNQKSNISLDLTKSISRPSKLNNSSKARVIIDFRKKKKK
jgi:hypothetical protein